MMLDEFHFIVSLMIALPAKLPLTGLPTYRLTSPTRFAHFRFFERDRPADEEPRDNPDEWKKQHSQNEPGEGEAEQSPRHHLGCVVVQQRKTEQGDEKGGGTGD